MRDTTQLRSLLLAHDGWLLLETGLERYCPTEEMKQEFEQLAKDTVDIAIVNLRGSTLLVHPMVKVEDAVAELFDREEEQFLKTMG